MGRRIGGYGLVNYRTHPTNERYKVFAFDSIEEADMMEDELKKRSVWFERDSDTVKHGTVYLIGVNKTDFNKAMNANFAVSAVHRNPMIKNKFLRYALIIMTVSLVTLGVIGYVKNMQKLDEMSEQVENE
jgi:magnesium-transporting ATPase (P-type)